MADDQSAASQSALDAKNAAFWNEPCGSLAASDLGIGSSDRASLAVFDKWFFEFYPYLDRFVPFGSVRDKDVLEVGLGYGSVSQRLAEHGARLTALDIADGPLAGVRRRLAYAGLRGTVVRGSILDPPFPAGSFDYIVGIGCYHHTGDLPRAVERTAALLREGGGATIMVYSATAFLRWLRDPVRTLGYIASVAAGDPPPLPMVDTKEYDTDSHGQGAPETVLISKTHLTRLLRRHFTRVQVSRANAGVPRVLQIVPRAVWLATLGRAAGLDLYAQVSK